MTPEGFDNKTNFFTLLTALLAKGMNLTLTMTMVEDKITVGVRPQRPDVKDKAMEFIRSLVITNTAQELDESFFLTITQPLAKMDELAQELKTFEDSLEQAKKASKMSQPKTTGGSGGSSSKKPQAKKKVVKKPVVKKAPAKPVVTKSEEELVKEVEAYMTNATVVMEVTPAKALDELKKAQALVRAPINPESVKRLTSDINILKTAAGDAMYQKTFNTKLELANNQVVNKDIRRVKESIATLTGMVKIFKLELRRIDAGEKLKDVVNKLKELEAEKTQADLLFRSQKQFDVARDRIDKMDYPAGMKALKNVLDIYPEHPDALALKQEIISKFGEEKVNQLMS